MNRRKFYQKALCLALLGMSLSSCSQDKHPDYFNDKAFYNEITYGDQYIEFVKCLKFDDLSCPDLYPGFDSLDIKRWITPDEDGYKPKLLAMTESMVKYYSKEKQGDFFALTMYLKENGFSSRKLTDTMLELTLLLDSTNLAANYELAKLRLVEGGYLGLTHFLMDRIHEIYPDNAEIKRIKNQIENDYGKDTYEKTMTYKEYLELNPHYIPPNE